MNAAAAETPEQRFQNGKISLRDYLESCIHGVQEYMEARLVAERQYMEAIVSRDVTRLEGTIHSGIAQTEMNTAAIEKAITVQDTMTQSRLESHNKFREQIEKERIELVRKDDLARVEKEMAMRFEVVQDKVDTAAVGMREKVDAAALSMDKVLTAFESRLSNMEGRWMATTVGGGLLIAAISIGVTVIEFLRG